MSGITFWGFRKLRIYPKVGAAGHDYSPDGPTGCPSALLWLLNLDCEASRAYWFRQPFVRSLGTLRLAGRCDILAPHTAQACFREEKTHGRRPRESGLQTLHSGIRK